MKKRIVAMALVGVILCFATIAYGAEPTSHKICKALVGLKYANTSIWGMTTQSVKEDIIDKNIAHILAKNNCEMITDEKYTTKLQSKGYADYVSAERADILDSYKDDGFRYLIFVEIEPVRAARPFGYESSAYVKIIDAESGKYVFSGKLHKLTKWGGAGTVIYKIGMDIANTLNEKAFGSIIPSK